MPGDNNWDHCLPTAYWGCKELPLARHHREGRREKKRTERRQGRGKGSKQQAATKKEKKQAQKEKDREGEKKKETGNTAYLLPLARHHREGRKERRREQRSKQQAASPKEACVCGEQSVDGQQNFVSQGEQST